MGVCSTLIPFLTNPLTYLGIGGVTIVGAALYSYSSYTFLPSLILFSRLSSGVNFVFNLVSKAVESGALKLVAAYTTFEGTIQLFLEKGISKELFVTAGAEFIEKTSLSVKNIVEGISTLNQWLTTSNEGVCMLAQNNELLLTGLISVWTGIAAYIFVIWVWNMAWYDWRNKEMEQQQLLLIIIVVSSVSLAVYGFDVVSQGWSNTFSLVDTLANNVGNMSANNTGTG
jgi:hypothetical protein